MHPPLTSENTTATTRKHAFGVAARSLAWLARAVALGAVALATVPGARAEVVYSGTLNVTATSDSTGVYLDPDDFTTSTTGTFAGWGIHFFQGGSFKFVQPNSSDSNRGATNNLSFGTTVNTATFGQSLTQVSDGYVGMRFTGDDSQIHYGWVNVTWSGFTVTVVSAAYNATPNGTITAGQTVPEPAHAALLLGAGAVGLLFWHKRRKSLRTAA